VKHDNKTGQYLTAFLTSAPRICSGSAMMAHSMVKTIFFCYQIKVSFCYPFRHAESRQRSRQRSAVLAHRGTQVRRSQPELVSVCLQRPASLARFKY